MANANQNNGNKEKILKENLKERIEAKLITRGIYNPETAADEQIYQATVSAIKDIMLEYRDSFKKRIKEKHAKDWEYFMAGVTDVCAGNEEGVIL